MGYEGRSGEGMLAGQGVEQFFQRGALLGGEVRGVELPGDDVGGGRVGDGDGAELVEEIQRVRRPGMGGP